MDSFLYYIVPMHIPLTLKGNFNFDHNLVPNNLVSASPPPKKNYLMFSTISNDSACLCKVINSIKNWSSFFDFWNSLKTQNQMVSSKIKYPLDTGGNNKRVFMQLVIVPKILNNGCLWYPVFFTNSFMKIFFLGFWKEPKLKILLLLEESKLAILWFWNIF